MVRYFVIVIGSFELPCYAEFVRMRKLQLEKYNIPHLFLFDGDMPDTYKLGPNDRYYDKELPPWPVMNKINSRPNPLVPHMILKFLKGIKEFDETKYDHIVRLNLSTFVDFPKFDILLQKLPKKYFAGGCLQSFRMTDWKINPHDSVEFITGTCMIFSSDVITFFKAFPLSSYILYEQNDDVVLSFISKLYVNTLTHVNTCIVEHLNTPSPVGHIIYRIKHQNRNDDIIRWKMLLKLCDDI
jgi:hypothetical protein